MDQMQRMTLIESMRKRPGMYLGSIDSCGLYHLLRILINDAMYACLIGMDKTILVDLQLDGGIRVRCNALLHPFSSPSDLPQSLQDAFLGKGDSPAPDQSWWYNLCLVNALSRSLRVSIHQGEHLWQQEFHNQQPVSSASERTGTMETATILTFYPDEAIFEDALAPGEQIAHYLSQSSYLVPGFTFNLNDHRSSSTRVSHFPQTDGVGQYVADLTRDQQPLGSPIVIKDEAAGWSLILGQQPLGSPIASRDEVGQTTIHIAFQYGKGPGQILSFANNQPTMEHGSHVAGFLDALQRVLRKVSRRSGASENEGFPQDRVTTHLTAVMSIWTTRPSFAGSTRSKLDSPEVRRAVYDATKKELQSFFDIHPDAVRQLLAHLPPGRGPSRKERASV